VRRRGNAASPDRGRCRRAGPGRGEETSLGLPSEPEPPPESMQLATASRKLHHSIGQVVPRRRRRPAEAVRELLDETRRKIYAILAEESRAGRGAPARAPPRKPTGWGRLQKGRPPRTHAYRDTCLSSRGRSPEARACRSLLISSIAGETVQLIRLRRLDQSQKSIRGKVPTLAQNRVQAQCAQPSNGLCRGSAASTARPPTRR
jgi:hypothetical protein